MGKRARWASLAALVLVLGVTGCNSCNDKRSSNGPTLVASAPVLDPDVEVVGEEPGDAGGRMLTSSDMALSDTEVYWIDHDQRRVLARAKTGGETREVTNAEGGRIEGIGSSHDGVFVADLPTAWHARILHIATDGRRVELANVDARFFALASFGRAGTEGLFVRDDTGLLVLKRGLPPKRIASFDFATALAACPFGATWLATAVPPDAGFDQLFDARAQRASAIMVYRETAGGDGAVTTLVSSLAEVGIGDLACDAESVFWADMSGLHRVLASGTGESTLLAKPPSTRKLAVVGDALYFGASSGIERIFLRSSDDGADGGRFAPRAFTRDSAVMIGRPIADATHVYWLTREGVRRKKR